MKPIIGLTEKAAARFQELLSGNPKPSVGVRIGVRSKGCSGLSYTLEFAYEKDRFDESVIDKGVTVLIDPKAIMFVLGTTVDYEDGPLESGFRFNNPAEKGRCGCGESFHV